MLKRLKIRQHFQIFNDTSNACADSGKIWDFTIETNSGVYNKMSKRILVVILSIFVSAVASALAPNQITVKLNGGHFGNSPNLATVSVTICEPNTDKCQKINDIQLDTGSTGLRIFKSSVLTGFNLKLPHATLAGKNAYECADFGLGDKVWGSVRYADVQIGGELAKNLRIQIQNTQNYTKHCPASGSGISDTNINGILGINPAPDDNLDANYFLCLNNGNSKCVLQTQPTRQVATQNPVYKFPLDNNGYSIEFPTVKSPEHRITGTLTFGINTERNNRLSSSIKRFSMFPSDSTGYIIAKLDGRKIGTLIDSGTNMNVLPTIKGLRVCAFYGKWHDSSTCPLKHFKIPITLLGIHPQKVFISASSVDFNNYKQFAALPGFTFANSKASTLILGVPFFFGKRIYFDILNHDNPKDPYLVQGNIAIMKSTNFTN